MSIPGTTLGTVVFRKLLNELSGDNCHCQVYFLDGHLVILIVLIRFTESLYMYRTLHCILVLVSLLSEFIEQILEHTALDEVRENDRTIGFDFPQKGRSLEDSEKKCKENTVESKGQNKRDTYVDHRREDLTFDELMSQVHRERHQGRVSSVRN